MLYTPHFLVGSAIANNVSNPILGLPLALVSHVVLDLIPHTDLDITAGFSLQEFLKLPPKRLALIVAVMAVDGLFLLASLLWLFIFRPNPWYMILAGLVAIAPDLVEQGLMVFGMPLLGFQEKFQTRVGLLYGFISYPIVCLIAFFFL